MGKEETEENGTSAYGRRDMTKFSPAIRILLVLSSLFLFFLFAASPAYGQVEIRSTCYNSEAVVTENVMTNNADYSSVTVLLPYSGYAGLPYSIISDGAGKSVDEEFSEFSHRIFAGNGGNCENIEASLKTESESGGFEWKGGVTASSYGLSMEMSVGGEIYDGNLEASYSNTNSATREEVSTTNSGYSSDASITPQSITYNGVSKSQNEDTCGFSSKTKAENIGKIATIEASLKEESPASEGADHMWTKSIVLLLESSSMEESILIKSKEGWMMVPGDSRSSITAGMKFEAYDSASGEPLFPTQYVPPGGEPLYILASRMETGLLDINQSIDLTMSATWGPGGEPTP
jgi:hypothetical protein